jgi:hypothetical protein
LESRLFLLIFARKTVKRRKRRKFPEKEEMEEAFSEKGGKGGAFTSQILSLSNVNSSLINIFR